MPSLDPAVLTKAREALADPSQRCDVYYRPAPDFDYGDKSLAAALMRAGLKFDPVFSKSAIRMQKSTYDLIKMYESLGGCGGLKLSEFLREVLADGAHL